MLHEIAKPRQVSGEGPGRWFTDPYFDLIVWYERERTVIAGFQLCYDKERDERAVTYRRGQGFDHKRIDYSEVSGRIKMTLVVVPDGTFNYSTIAERSRRQSQKIEPEVREFVHKMLTSYS